MAEQTSHQTTPEAVLAWLVESCAAQGVPLTVEDVETLQRVAHKLSGA